MLGRTFAFLTCSGMLAACAIYDDSLLPRAGVGGSPLGAGGTGTLAGAGGAAPDNDGEPGAGGADAIGAAGIGGGGDASVGGGGTGGGAPGAGGNGGSTVTADASGRDVVDAAVVDRSDVSTTPGCPTLIDNMELGIGRIADNCRIGYWFTYNDGTPGGSQQPPTTTTFAPLMLPTPRTAMSSWAAHTNGGGYPNGAGMGVNFNAAASTGRRPYDASAYTGVTFWIMGSGTLFMAMPTKDTDPAGGICGQGGRGACFDHFQMPVGAISTTQWRQVTILFSQLAQQRFGYQPPGGFDKTAVYGVQWGVETNASFDFWIDDVSFVTADGGS
jgi:hypothetical protein